MDLSRKNTPETKIEAPAATPRPVGESITAPAPMVPSQEVGVAPLGVDVSGLGSMEKAVRKDLQDELSKLYKASYNLLEKGGQNFANQLVAVADAPGLDSRVDSQLGGPVVWLNLSEGARVPDQVSAGELKGALAELSQAARHYLKLATPRSKDRLYVVTTATRQVLKNAEKDESPVVASRQESGTAPLGVDLSALPKVAGPSLELRLRDALDRAADTLLLQYELGMRSGVIKQLFPEERGGSRENMALVATMALKAQDDSSRGLEDLEQFFKRTGQPPIPLADALDNWLNGNRMEVSNLVLEVQEGLPYEDYQMRMASFTVALMRQVENCENGGAKAVADYFVANAGPGHRMGWLIERAEEISSTCPEMELSITRPEEVLEIDRQAAKLGLTPVEVSEWAEGRLDWGKVPLVIDSVPLPPGRFLNKVEQVAASIVADAWERTKFDEDRDYLDYSEVCNYLLQEVHPDVIATYVLNEKQ